MNNDHAFQTSIKTNPKGFVRIIFLILIVLTVTLLLNMNFWAGTETSRFSGTFQYTEESWTYKKGETILEPQLTVPAFRNMDQGESYSISAPLTYDGSRDTSPTCFFFVDHMYCRVLLDGETVFSYMPEDIKKPDRSKSPGNVYVSAPLPRDCLGKELTIEFFPALDANIDYQLPNPSFGDYSTQLAMIFREDLPHNIIALLTLFLGLSTILYSTIAMSGSSYREGLFIGIFGILFCLYNITESDFDFYIISNPYFTYLLDYITFSTIPIFFLAFLRERLSEKQKKISLILICASIGMVAAELLLHFTGLMDMREFLPIIHIVYFAAIITHIILFWTDKKDRWKKHLILQLFPILFGMMIDSMVYYMHWQLNSSDSTFTAIGVLIFLISELFHVWQYSVKVYMESMQSRVYQQMAYVDSLTGIGNHRAFEIIRSNPSQDRKSYKTLTVISADLNNLKYTNDTLGHASGDFLIRSAANVLSDLSADYGHVFRIGGDEFIAFLYDMSSRELEHRLRIMRENIEEINQNSRAKLSIALGIQDCDSDIDTALARADRKMYQDKTIYKASQTE